MRVKETYQNLEHIDLSPTATEVGGAYLDGLDFLYEIVDLIFAGGRRVLKHLQKERIINTQFKLHNIILSVRAMV